MLFNTPLRYPGGKAKLSNFVMKIIEKNNLHDLHYAEPFAGGAGLALNLLTKGYAKKIYLNDINPAIYAFWYSIINHTHDFCKKIEKTDVTIDEWHHQRKIMVHAKFNNIFELGYSTFFLNRTNRSGILLGGIIGGKEQKGNWKLDARFNKYNLIERIERIERISKYRNNIIISNLDAKEFIQKTIKQLPINSLTYFDPPYYVKGKGLYENHYIHEDHEVIANIIQTEISTPWIVSYDNVEPIQKMYSKSKFLSYDINYSVQNKYKGSEIMFFSKKLNFPVEKYPTKTKI